MEKSQNQLRFGVLSTASIAPRFIKAVEDAGNCSVRALASRNLNKAQEKAKLWNVPIAYGSYMELINDPEIDIIYVCLINSEHYHYSRLSLEAGKHVLCEKPFSLKESEAKELFNIARNKKLFIMEAEKVVFLPVVNKIKDLIKEGLLGQIRMAEFSSSFEATYNNWLYDPTKGGGILTSNAIYSIQLMQYLFDKKIISWSGLCTKAETGVDNQYSISCLLENNILFSCNTSTCVSTVNHGCLYGEKGFVDIPNYWKARTAILNVKGEKPIELSFPCEHELVYEVLHVVECIQNGLCESPIMNEEMTLSAIHVINEIKKLWNLQ